MLTGINIYKSFDNLEVLKDINIEIERGKIVSIVGKSGAGKSTLLYILSTLDKATNGKVLFDNKKLDELKGDDLSNFRNKKIGFIFQFHNLLSEFTVLENVSIPALISSSDKEKIIIKAKEILKKLDLFDRLNLDSENSQNLIKMIKKLNKEYNQTFVIVTHNKDFLKISDYSYTIKDGRIKLN